MATDIATLAIKVENADVVKATTSVGSLGVAAEKTEKSTTRLTRRIALLEIEARNMDAAMRRGGAAMNALEAEAREMDAALERSRRAMHLVELEARKMDAAIDASRNRFGAFSAGMGKVTAGMASLQAAAAAVAAALALREVAGLADSFTNLQSRLRLVTTGTENLAAVQAALFRVSQETRTSIESTAGLYASLARSTKALGLSQQDLVDITRTTSQAFKLSGASAAETDNAVRQLGQAFASGVLRGDEFNSMAENAPRLQQALADSLGVSIGQLRKMAEEGKLTSDVLAKAFLDAGKTVAAEAATMPMTIGDAMQKLKNEVLVAIGAMDRVSGGSTAIVAALEKIAGAVQLAAKGWIYWSSAVQHAAAALEVFDTTAGKTISQKLQEWRELRTVIDNTRDAALAAINAPAGAVSTDRGAGGDKPVPFDKAVVATLAQRDAEIAKLNALNKAYGASNATLTLLGNAYDAQAERSQNAVGHTAAETAALNRRTSAMQAAKDAAVLLALAEDARTQVRDAQRGESEAIRNAKQELALAGLSAEAAAHRRIDMQAENDLAAARLRFAMMTKDLDRERADVAATILKREQDIYASTERRAEAVRRIGHATATVSAEMDKQKKAEDEMAREQERRAKEIRRATVSNIEGILTDLAAGRNPLIALAEGFKRAMIRAVSEALAERFLASKFAAMLGIGVEGAAKKQDQAGNKMVAAGKSMNEAADKILRAMGYDPDARPRRPEGQQPTVGGIAGMIRQYAAPVVASALAGYATGQALSSQKHGTMGNLVRGALGGAASGAMAGAALGGPPGAVVGAVVGFVSGLFGASKAMKEAAKQARELRAALEVTMDGLRAEVGKDALAANIAAVEAQRETIRKQIEEAYQGGDKNSATVRERNRQLAELNRLEDERIRQLREEAAVLQQRTIEDYQARLDAATPGNEREEAIAANARKLDREIEDLIRSFGPEIDAREAETLAVARAATAAEKEAFARDRATASLNAFTTSVNTVTGFKLADLNPYIQEFAEGRPYPGSFPAPVNPFVPPMTPLTPSVPQLSRTGTVATQPISVNINAGAIVVQESKTPQATADEIVARVRGIIMPTVLTELDKEKNAGNGLASDRHLALNKMKLGPGAPPWRS